MNYFKYLLKNNIWILLSFWSLVCFFMWYSEPSPNEQLWVFLFMGAITAAFLIGNYLKWRQL